MDYNDKLEDAWLDALNAHDVEGVEACFTDDAVFTDIGTGQVARGRDELRRSVEGLFATFGDLRIERTSAVTDGTTLAHEFTMSGVHSGSVPGSKPPVRASRRRARSCASCGTASSAGPRSTGTWPTCSPRSESCTPAAESRSVAT